MALAPGVLESLCGLDSDWLLIPIDGRKRPVDPGSGEPLGQWASAGLSLEDFTAAAAGSPHVQAVGLVLGPASGVLAVDFDGPGVAACFQRIYGCPPGELPATVGWSSGLPQRAQLAYRVPLEYWDCLRGRRSWGPLSADHTPTSPQPAGGPGGKRRRATVLELRWQGHQSVIAGVHPLSGSYRWLEGRSPAQVQVADAPDWLLEPLFKRPEEPVEADFAPRSDDQERAIELLDHIQPREDYDGWLTVGMALHSIDPGLLNHWIAWSRGCSSFNAEECQAKWRSFKGRGVTIGTLFHFAGLDGYRPCRLTSSTSNPVPGEDPSSSPESQPERPKQHTEPPRDQQIAVLLEQLLDLLLDTQDTWAQEQAVRASLWSLGVNGQAVDERLYYALAGRWGLPLQTSHRGGNRNRSLADPIASPAEDLLPGFLLWRRDHLLFGAGGTGKTLAPAAGEALLIQPLQIGCHRQRIAVATAMQPLQQGCRQLGAAACGQGREQLEQLRIAGGPRRCQLGIATLQRNEVEEPLEIQQPGVAVQGVAALAQGTGLDAGLQLAVRAVDVGPQVAPVARFQPHHRRKPFPPLRRTGGLQQLGAVLLDHRFSDGVLSLAVPLQAEVSGGIEPPAHPLHRQGEVEGLGDRQPVLASGVGGIEDNRLSGLQRSPQPLTDACLNRSPGGIDPA